MFLIAQSNYYALFFYTAYIIKTDSKQLFNKLFHKANNITNILSFLEKIQLNKTHDTNSL